MTKKIDVKEFATRVERMCDFFLSKIERNGKKDHMVLVDLKEDAADLATEQTITSDHLVGGLDDYMKGAPDEPSSGDGK